MTYIKAAVAEGRPLFAHGIMEFSLPHEPIYCSATTCKYCQAHKPKEGALMAEDWQTWAPDGAYIIMDEVQHIYRPRSGSTILPASVAAFETHRHSGIDFLLMTQNPMLMDKNIRLLVSKHIHLKGTWSHRVQHEWGECSDDTKRTAGAIKSVYTLNKDNFKLYKSAELHTKVKRKIPFQLYVLIAAVLLGVYVFWKISGRFDERMNPQAAAVESSSQVSLETTGFSSREIGDVFDRVPVEELFVESAPAFSHLVQVVAYPRLAGCIRGNLKCKCYTQQATLLDVSLNQCLAFVANPPFNPYLEVEDNRDFSNQSDLSLGNAGVASRPVRSEPVLTDLDDQLRLPYNSSNTFGYSKPYQGRHTPN
jgi:zona occludens toxin